MPATALPAQQLRRTIDPNSLGFDTTARLAGTPLGWIGQDRAAAAAQLGLALNQPDYHLFVLGETGSGRSSLLEQAMHTAAQQRPVPPDLCFAHQFAHPSRPRALRLPAGQGLRLQQAMAALCKQLPDELAQRISQPDVRAQALAIEQQYQTAEAAAFAQLQTFAKQHHYQLERQGRDGSELVLIPLGNDGKPLANPHSNTPQQAAAQAQLQAHIGDFIAQIRPLDRTRTQAQQALLHNTAAPLVAAAIASVQSSLTLPPADAASVQDWLAQVEHALLQHVQLLATGSADSTTDSATNANNAPTSADDSSDDPNADDDTQDALDELLERCQVNLAINHAHSTCAPVVIEDNPHQRSLFGSIEAPGDARSEAPPNHMAIHAGSLLQAHGGFIMLHLRDLAGPEGLWDRLRRFLRTHRLHIEETAASGHSAHLQPQAISVHTTIVLIGSVDEYYALQEADPDTAQRFKIKVDFSDTFAASAATYQATAAWVAHTCQQRGLPPFDAAAVAAIIEHTHRQAEDQTRQSALFGRTETLLIESAAACTARMANLAQANPSPEGNAGTAPTVQAQDIAAALHAHALRHNQPEEELLDSITQGERLISVQGTVLGQINALTQIDLGDYCFGFPVRITARTFAGQQGLLNIQREVDMSGPIHDKGMLILHGYLKALFSHVAPLALNASIVFEQEYSGVEGDSASCAELYALLSSLSGLPLQQGIAVTGALNQHGEVLPVGGINEKIEGWFTVCQQAGLNGQQGVLIPARNQRHLMLAPHVQTAVERGQFHVYTMGHVSEGIALLTGQASGMAPADLPAQGSDDIQTTVLQRAENTLRAYRRACQSAGGGRRGRG